ncbi:MAG: hypothetical protein HY559_00995 [Gammaproteobacteria bacterium]|nr:hypothetical protein [Gammaproteobacteria bacterium]
MPISTQLPKGCSSMRGASALPRRANLGGELAQHANRFYMLTIKRESLNSKEISLKKRLADIREQLKRLDSEIQTAQSSYNKLSSHQRKKSGRNGNNKGCGVELRY